MHEIFRGLSPGARVLGLGSRSGSFDPADCPFALVVRLDLDPTGHVQADAARLPFADGSFDVVISNHSLEHMTELDDVLFELGRVVRRTGSLYIAVPDSTTFSDRVYRWIYHGGGHVNPFRSAAELQALVQRHVRLPYAGCRLLHSSFGFLLNEHFHPRPPRRMWLFGNGHYVVIATLSWLTRLFDSILRTRLSVYGWALYFGRTDEPVDTHAWTNVCVKCGAARPSELLPRTLIYHCASCGAWNLRT